VEIRRLVANFQRLTDLVIALAERNKMQAFPLAVGQMGKGFAVRNRRPKSKVRA